MSRFSWLWPEYLNTSISRFVLILSGAVSVILGFISMFINTSEINDKLWFIGSYIALVVALQPWKRSKRRLILDDKISNVSLHQIQNKYYIKLMNTSHDVTIYNCGIKIIASDPPLACIDMMLPSERGETDRVDLTPGDNCSFNICTIMATQLFIGKPRADTIASLTKHEIHLRVTGDGTAYIDRSILIDPASGKVEFIA